MHNPNVLQHPDFCRGGDADDIRQQWNNFVEPYTDKSEEIKAALRARIAAGGSKPETPEFPSREFSPKPD